VCIGEYWGGTECWRRGHQYSMVDHFARCARWTYSTSSARPCHVEGLLLTYVLLLCMVVFSLPKKILGIF